MAAHARNGDGDRCAMGARWAHNNNLETTQHNTRPQAGRQAGRLAGKLAGRQAGRQAGKLAGRLTGRLTGRHAGRQPGSESRRQWVSEGVLGRAPSLWCAHRGSSSCSSKSDATWRGWR